MTSTRTIGGDSHANACTMTLPIARFPPDILGQIILPKFVLRLYRCGDSLLNQKMRQCDYLSLVIKDRWIDDRQRRVQWPSHFLAAPNHLTAFEFISNQNRDCVHIINPITLATLPRQLKSLKIAIPNADTCVNTMHWDAAFLELRVLKVVNTNRHRNFMVYPGSLGAGQLPPQLESFESSHWVDEEPVRGLIGPDQIAWVSTLLRVAKSGVLPSSLTCLRISSLSAFGTWWESATETQLCELVAMLPQSLIDLQVAGVANWPIQAMCASHAFQTCNLYPYTYLPSPQNPLAAHLPRQLTALHLSSFEKVFNNTQFVSSLPSCLRVLELFGWSGVDNITLPILPSSLEVFDANCTFNQCAPGFTWPLKLHTLLVQYYNIAVPLPSTLTELTITMPNNHDDKSNIILPDSLRMLSMAIPNLITHRQVLRQVPSSVTVLQLKSGAQDPTDVLQQFDWSGLERLTSLTIFTIYGKSLISALCLTPQPLLLAPSVTSVSFWDMGDRIPIHLDVLKKLPSSLHVLSASMSPETAIAALSHFTQLCNLELFLKFVTDDISDSERVRYFSTFQHSTAYKDMTELWAALPPCLERLMICVATPRVMLNSPTVLPRHLRRAIMHHTMMPDFEQIGIMPKLKILQCCLSKDHQLSSYMTHLPRLQQFTKT